MTDTKSQKHKIDVSMPKELYNEFREHMNRKQHDILDDSLVVSMSAWICGAIRTKLAAENHGTYKESIVRQIPEAAKYIKPDVKPDVKNMSDRSEHSDTTVFGLDPNDPDYIDKLADNLFASGKSLVSKSEQSEASEQAANDLVKKKRSHKKASEPSGKTEPSE